MRHSDITLVLGLDLDPNAPGGRAFQTAPIAPDATILSSRIQGHAFEGTFDGQGHAIRGLTLPLEENGETCSGALFGAIGEAGVVRDLSLLDVEISSPKSLRCLGGLAGANAGRIIRCCASGSIVLATPVRSFTSYEAGGLIGQNRGTVLQCCSSVQILGGQATLGGLAGSNYGTITDCYATGRVEGGSTRQTMGGLVGDNSGEIARCYAAGAVVPTDSFSTGGLAGSDRSPGVAASYFLQEVDGGGRDNGLGTALSRSQMSSRDSFLIWDFYGRQTDGREDPWFMSNQGYPVLSWQTQLTGLVAVPDATGLSEDQAAETLARKGLAAGKAGYDYDPCVPAGRVMAADPARLCTAGASVGLTISLGTYDWSQNPGGGTQANPYQLSTGGQLVCLAGRPDLWHSSFVLVDDLDMSHHLFGGAVIAPDQNQIDAEFQGTGFGGRLDGAGHAIKHLTITSCPWSLYVGLIGYAEPGAEIRRLRLTDAYVMTGTSNFYVGILAGRSLGAILDCSIQGNLLTGGHCGLVGGMVGFHEGSVTRCGIDCGIAANGCWIGGLAGVNLGQISQCAVQGYGELGGWTDVGGVAGLSSGGILDTYSMLSIAIPALEQLNAGGLVGSVTAAGRQSFTSGSGGRTITVEWQGSGESVIRNCYATGRISGGTHDPMNRIGGLASRVWDKCTLAGNVWDIESTGVRFSDTGTGLTTRQMMSSQTLAGYGFDFANTWTICEGKDYPRLRWEAVQCEAESEK